MITYGSTTLTSYNSIVRTEVYYYKSTSATSLSGGSWSTTKPTWENGKYIWQKIRTIYEDETYTESDPVNITGQQGATGTAAYSYKLNSSDSIIGKTKDGEYTIKKITFSATYKQGTGAVSVYNGRFKIESTTNGSTWKTEYTSSGNESSKEFTIPDDIIAIKCSLYQSDGTTVLLDIVTVPVVKDGVDAIGLRDSIPYYLASDKDTGITRLTQGWTRYRPQLTAEKKYLWVYYVSRYSEGATEPELIEIKDDLVHFVNNGDESPVESCVVDIEPVQDLHGYDSPWPPGGGVNILSPDLNFRQSVGSGVSIAVSADGIITLSGTAESINVFDASVSFPAGTYTFSGFNESAEVKVQIYIIDTQGTVPGSTGLERVNKTETFTASNELVKFRVRALAGYTGTFTFKPMLSSGTTIPTTWTPYSNICPITGWTGARVTRCGKNLLPQQLTQDTSTIVILGQSNATSFGTFLKAGTYTVSVQSSKSFAFYYRAKNGTENVHIGGYNVTSATFTLTEDLRIRLYAYLGAGLSVSDISNIQLELGSTATNYEPYSGQTYDITFPTEAGTVYGGTLDVTKGELVVDRAMVDLPSDMSWATWGVNYCTSGITGFYIYRYSMPSTLDFSNIGKAVLTNLLTINRGVWGGTTVSYATNTGGSWYEMVSIRNESADILSTDTNEEAVTKFKAFLASTPLNVLYELAEPMTYQLTPQEITMLCKENNIFADTGQTAISYYDNQTSTDPYVDYSLTSAFDASTDALDKAKEVAQDLADLQAQIDGKIETWCQITDPSTAWTTTELKNQHNGDLWYYTGESTSSYKNNTTYKYTASTNKWTAYSASTDLFDKIDAKTSIYYGKPSAVTQNLEVGDYLVDSTDGCSYHWDGSKWVKLTDYNAAIDSIEVGGRNLARNTQGAIIDKIGSAEGSRAEYAAFDLGCALPLNDNDDISISFDLYMVVHTAKPKLNIYNTNNQGVHRTCVMTNVLSGTSYEIGDVIDKHIAFVSTIHDRKSPTLPHDYLEFYSEYGSNNFFRISNLKVEKGNKPTSWTPAPEDVDASITTAQSTADEALAATQPISSKTFTDIIGTANDIANASFYFAKVHPTTYTDPWMVKMKIKASVPSDTNFRKTVDITIHGCRSNFISYDSIVANYNSNPIYYLNLYRATQAGIETNKKGHALGFGLRSSTSPIDTNKKRTFEVDLLEVDGCTVDWIDTPVKYADMDGTGSTNYVGCTELGITSNGQNATNNGNTYDRIKYSTIKAAEAIARYNIIVGTSAGYKHLKSGTPWDITYPILYADGALNANATGSSNYLTIPFTVTTTQAITLTPYKPVYIEGTLEGTTFTPVDTTPLTQTVPTSDNGHQYILLGSAYSTTAINLEAEHPIYQFQNGNFVTVAEAASRIGANAENLIKATYAVCNTAAGTNAKTADCTNFELYEGVRIQVTFTNANTAEAPTLNIHNTGAKAIYINKTVTSSSNLLLWTAGSKMEFVYDGTGWIAQNVPYALYGTCSTGASTAAKAVTCNEAVICKGTTISVNMTNTNTAANATMNVGSTLAKDIYANGAKLTTNSRFNWRANTTQKFVFDGQVWRMDDDSVKALATAYITEIDDDGIMVHPEDDSNSGWAISDAIQLFKNGISYIKLWIENNIPKIRIGKEDQGHIILDNDSVDVKNNNKVLASFGATSVIGDENDWHQTIAANQITFAKGNDTITYISPDKLYTINAEVADAFYISNYSIRNASDGKLVIGLRR